MNNNNSRFIVNNYKICFEKIFMKESYEERIKRVSEKYNFGEGSLICYFLNHKKAHEKQNFEKDERNNFSLIQEFGLCFEN